MSQRIATTLSPQLPRFLARQPSSICRISKSSPTSYHLSRLQTHTPHHLPSSYRAFATSPTLCKKTGKANLAHARSDSAPPVTDSTPATAVDEAYDLSTLESQILKAIERLTHELSELRAGGRFNPQHLEQLRVTLKPTGSALDAKETVRLSDLAQVIPKGRIVSVVAGDEDHIKPLMSTIQASPYSLTPRPPTPDAPTTITVPIPPPTGESRKAALATAQKAEERANLAIHNARTAHNKKLRSFEVSRAVRPDDIKKAKSQMEDCVKKGSGEVKRIFQAAKKVLVDDA